MLMFKSFCRDGRYSVSGGFLAAGALRCTRHAQELQSGAATANLRTANG